MAKRTGVVRDILQIHDAPQKDLAAGLAREVDSTLCNCTKSESVRSRSKVWRGGRSPTDKR
jgi:hypothetical protein